MATYYTNYFRGGSSPSSDGDWRFYFTTSISQNKANNTSTITIRHYIQFKNQPYLQNQGRDWVTGNSLNGGSYSYYTSAYAPGAGDSTYLVSTQTRTVTHNVDGSKTITLAFRGGFAYFISSDPNTHYNFLYTGTKTIKLPTINRTSKITSNATSNAGKQFGQETTFTITKPEGTNYTHTLTYKINDTTYSIAENTSSTSINYVFPEYLVTFFPKNEKVSIVVNCKSQNGTSSTTTVYLTVPSSYVPSCFLELEECGDVPSSWGIYVKSKSRVKGTISAYGTGGSTITNYSSSGNKQTFNTQTFETGYLTNAGEDISFTSIVKDSRGRTATSTKTIEVLEYSQPTIINAIVQRCLEDGTINEDGTFGKCTIEYSISAINNGITDLNTKQASISLGTETKTATLPNYEGKYTFDTLFTDLDTKSSYDFKFLLIDYFNSTPQTFQLSPSFVTRSFLAGGKGVTLGQTATQEGFHSYMDNTFHKDTYMEQQNIKGLVTIKSGNVYVRYIEEA